MQSYAIFAKSWRGETADGKYLFIEPDFPPHECRHDAIFPPLDVPIFACVPESIPLYYQTKSATAESRPGFADRARGPLGARDNHVEQRCQPDGWQLGRRYELDRRSRADGSG